ncbi:proline-rich proteoglycan 2 [Equus przewalskii]|uniref:Proline-rich proteoglycan 2 n=1 Tax=Equus przewalskii TaxID=9798 RepID=A0ABM4QC43_EQUPR
MPGRLAPASLRWAQGVPPPPKQSFPRAPQSPRQGRDLAPSPASRARLPRGRPERARAGGGPRRPPAAGRPQAAAGERLPAGGGARAAEPGVLRGRTGPAERRAVLAGNAFPKSPTGQNCTGFKHENAAIEKGV